MSHEFIQINKHYQQPRLTQVDLDPFAQFTMWFEAAEASARSNELVNAMTVATVGADGRPSARLVLLKHFDKQGFVFFTNYHSKKGQQINANPNVALLFWWDQLARQIRIEGRAEQVSWQLSDEYFHSRSKSSQLSAVVSEQSAVINDMQELHWEYRQLQQEFDDENMLVPRPPHWGGYIVKPDLFEFWQGGEHRLHDRFQYRLVANERWQIERLAP